MRPPQARLGPAMTRRAMLAPRSAAGNRRRIVHLRNSWPVLAGGPGFGRETTSLPEWFRPRAYHAVDGPSARRSAPLHAEGMASRARRNSRIRRREAPGTDELGR